MILSFKCKYTKEFWLTGKSKKIPSTLLKTALRKLHMLNNAQELKDLQSPPNNKLKPLKADRFNQFSIRINDQWRICFIWQNQAAYDVEIVDYH